MDHKEVGRFWDENAEAWTKLSRAGYDVYRDFLNTPAFIEMLPDVRGLRGLDIGCGEGSNTRLLAGRGARVVAVDVSEKFIAFAREEEARRPMGIEYQVASAVELPFPEASFDFAVAFMSMMDIPEYEKALAEAFRVLRPGGFLQFSITHPCSDTPHRRNLRDAGRKTYALEVGGYFAGTPDRILLGGGEGAVRRGRGRPPVPQRAGHAGDGLLPPSSLPEEAVGIDAPPLRIVLNRKPPIENPTAPGLPRSCCRT